MGLGACWREGTHDGALGKKKKVQSCSFRATRAPEVEGDDDACLHIWGFDASRIPTAGSRDTNL